MTRIFHVSSVKNIVKSLMVKNSTQLQNFQHPFMDVLIHLFYPE